MKLALIFLSTLLTITHQQYQNPMGLNWFPFQPMTYYYQPFYCNNLQNPFNCKYRPLSPIMSHPLYDELLHQGTTDSEIVNEENDDNNPYPDVQSKITGFKNRPFHDKQNPRFFYFGSASTYTNPFFKTATFTLTSTVSLTSVQICAPSSAFATGAPACRRKRSDIDISWINEPTGSNQFYLAPTKTQKVESTMLPTKLLQEESRRNINHGLASSKQETKVDGPEPQNGNRIGRTIFCQYVASTTITSFTFLQTVVTKTVNLATGNMANCRPEGYINC